MLAEGTSKGGFLSVMINQYNKPLIKKYLQDFDGIRSDYEMVDFIANEKPEMLPGLFAVAKEYEYQERMIAYLEKLP